MSIQLVEHLNKNNSLGEEQFSFRTKTSTNMAIYKLMNEIQKALNRKNLLEVFFVTSKRLLTVSITRFCYWNWNSMVSKEKQSYGLNRVSETSIKRL
jgi:hypothetical protein